MQDWAPRLIGRRHNRRYASDDHAHVTVWDDGGAGKTPRTNVALAAAAVEGMQMRERARRRCNYTHMALHKQELRNSVLNAAFLPPVLL